MNQRSFIVLGLFVVGLTLGVVVGRFSMPAAAVASGPAADRALVSPELGETPETVFVVPDTDAAGEDASAGVSEAGLPEPAGVREITATTFAVTRVIDGDTFRVEYDGDLTSVRLRDIDAPERGDPRAAAATEELRRLVDGQTVRLEFGPGRKRDGFGRLLCHVFVNDLDIGQHLLNAGLVEEYQPGPRKSKTP